jgi:hypothetical protein
MAAKPDLWDDRGWSVGARVQMAPDGAFAVSWPIQNTLGNYPAERLLPSGELFSVPPGPNHGAAGATPGRTFGEGGG